ncbi:peroxidase-related enzyme [bacterium]|nr:peroxidase-related enzyme [candidate division CSSED10-310 bacterium]
MTWIEVIKDEDATPDLKAAYEKIRKSRGKIANIMKIHSFEPSLMTMHLKLYEKIMFDSKGITRAEREMIAVIVSSANGCDYCIQHHSEALNHYWNDTLKIKQFVEDFQSVDLSPREDRLIDYAIKLTNTPEQMCKSDLIHLKQIGLSDHDILKLNLVVSYFNFVNRIALGLGVSYSEDEISGYIF